MRKKVVRVHGNQHKEAGGQRAHEILGYHGDDVAKTQENKHVVRTQNVQ